LLQVLLGACGKTVVPPEKEKEETPETGPVTLTVATCNVLKPSGRRTEMSMDDAIVRKALAQSVTKTGADIIGFNELDETLIGSGRYSLSGACTALRDFSWSLEWPNKTHQNSSVSYSYANGFAYNSANLKLEESGYVWLSKEEEAWYVKSSSAYSRAGNPDRTCIWARFTHKASAKTFWLFVTHLPTDSQGGSYNMAGVVNSFAAHKAGSTPAILTGDMNSALGSATYRRLIGYWQDGNVDATWGTLSGSSKNYYYTADVFTRNRPDRRIDHIMTKGCTATDYAPVVVTYTVNGQAWCPSDHLPVKATITIE
jgi:endonuclease/exonuclease/phosphatase family metal-dependent hydrolase